MACIFHSLLSIERFESAAAFVTLRAWKLVTLGRSADVCAGPAAPQGPQACIETLPRENEASTFVAR